MNLVATLDGLARLDGDEVTLLDLPFPDVAALLAAGEGLISVDTAKIRRRIRIAELEGKLLAPLRSARSIWGIGLNYHSKARQTGRPLPEEPLLYLKAPAAMSGPNAVVDLPTHRSAQVDYEGEVAVVIGLPMYEVSPGDAWAHVAGISAANDVTARDVMAATGNPTVAKSFPGFGAIGASVLALSSVDNPADIPVRTWVNGQLRQESTTAEQIFHIPDLLARISRYCTLEPGDVVLTGTPAGTGQDRNEFLRPGDVVEVSVGSVLPLRTEFHARP
jgi:2-keto-4-pentenoate hydratase/2-oxohepta-3-ene-1,7-dioic acid hydratase in catechol pathway